MVRSHISGRGEQNILCGNLPLVDAFYNCEVDDGSKRTMSTSGGLELLIIKLYLTKLS